MTTTWKVEYGLWDSPPREWRKIDPEHAHALAEGQEIRCSDCGDVIAPSGPVRVFVDQDGEAFRFFCGPCVVAFAQRRTQEHLMAEIVAMCPHPRSKGRVTQQLLGKGYRLGDIRLAFEELLEEGQLQADRRGMVKTKTTDETLFTEEEWG